MKYMNEHSFTYKLERVSGLNCPSKTLVTINEQIICFVNSKQSVKPIIAYATTMNEELIQDCTIKRKVRLALGIS